MKIHSYILGRPFPDSHYISCGDSVMSRITPHSFEIIMTLTNISREEKQAVINDMFYVGLFVYKQIPYIILDFGIYKCNVAINIQKICQVSINEWLKDDEDSIVVYLLEEVTGRIIGIRVCEFPLMTELKYLLRLQKRLSKEVIDSRIAEGESINTVQDMLNYSIFFGEVSESGILLNEIEETEEDIIF